MAKPNRLKLLRRRLSISAPRMIVRSHLPWPARWAFVAIMIGFSAALGLWAFDTGRQWTGHNTEYQRLQQQMPALQDELQALRQERDKAQAIANTADSLLKVEKATQQDLAEQVKTLQAENLNLKADLGFFERLMPASGGEALSIRGLQAEIAAPGQLRFQLLVMQPSHLPVEFSGSYELSLKGQLDGHAWTMAVPRAGHTMQFKQYQRLEGMIDYPAAAIVKQVEVNVLDAFGSIKARQTATL